MKLLILTCITATLLLFLSCNKSDNLNLDDKEIWKGVFYDGMSNTDVHDPQYNYILIIDDLNNIQVVSPSERPEEKVISIEILNESEMDLKWNINNETQIVRTNYSYNDQNELIIDKFTYTEAAIPFPNNLTSGKFIKQVKTNDQ